MVNERRAVVVLHTTTYSRGPILPSLPPSTVPAYRCTDDANTGALKERILQYSRGEGSVNENTPTTNQSAKLRWKIKASLADADAGTTEIENGAKEKED